jgi:hypothetical protein
VFWVSGNPGSETCRLDSGYLPVEPTVALVTAEDRAKLDRLDAAKRAAPPAIPRARGEPILPDRSRWLLCRFQNRDPGECVADNGVRAREARDTKQKSVTRKGRSPAARRLQGQCRDDISIILPPQRGSRTMSAAGVVELRDRSVGPGPCDNNELFCDVTIAVKS